MQRSSTGPGSRQWAGSFGQGARNILCRQLREALHAKRGKRRTLLSGLPSLWRRGIHLVFACEPRTDERTEARLPWVAMRATLRETGAAHRKERDYTYKKSAVICTCDTQRPEMGRHCNACCLHAYPCWSSCRPSQATGRSAGSELGPCSPSQATRIADRKTFCEGKVHASCLTPASLTWLVRPPRVPKFQQCCSRSRHNRAHQQDAGRFCWLAWPAPCCQHKQCISAAPIAHPARCGGQRKSAERQLPAAGSGTR